VSRFGPDTTAAELRALVPAPADVETDVRAILDAVRERGDAAVRELTARFDGAELSDPRVPVEHLDAAPGTLEPDVLAALGMAIANVGAVAEAQLREPLTVDLPQGQRLEIVELPVRRAAAYVPGGRATYPSTVVMCAVTARAAGVEELAVCSPPGPEGVVHPAVLAACSLCGVTEVYAMGGAQAVAALAYGTETIAPVAKIVGPGNAYVAAAKRLVFGKVGIDMIAGPSEVLVIADDTGNADWIAADLLAQAEHDASAQSILITDSARLAADVEKAVEAQLKTLPRAVIASASWADFGAIIMVKNLNDAIPLADAIAAEHLEIMTQDPDALAARIRNAGAVFLGPHTPEAIGDYVGGSNHVLPTARSARFSSGLGVLDFMKRTSLLKCDATNIRALGPAAIALGRAEKLEAHARSVAMRLGANDP
jgi:histidinol dehydrogenase